MKTKLLTLVLFSVLTFGFFSCSEEEVSPSDAPVLQQTTGSQAAGKGELDSDLFLDD